VVIGLPQMLMQSLSGSVIYGRAIILRVVLVVDAAIDEALLVIPVMFHLY